MKTQNDLDNEKFLPDTKQISYKSPSPANSQSTTDFKCARVCVSVCVCVHTSNSQNYYHRATWVLPLNLLDNG